MSLPIYLKPLEKDIIEELQLQGADDGTMVEVYGISGTKLGEAMTTLNKATIHTDAQAGSVVIVKVGNKAIKIKI